MRLLHPNWNSWFGKPIWSAEDEKPKRSRSNRAADIYYDHDTARYATKRCIREISATNESRKGYNSSSRSSYSIYWSRIQDGML